MKPEAYLDQAMSHRLPAEAYAHVKLPDISGKMEKDHREAILSVCSRPELIPLAQSITFRVGSELGELFSTPSADLIVMSPDSLAHHSLAALYIRWALELAISQRNVGEGISLGFFLGIGLMAAHTTKYYWDSMVEKEYELCRQEMPIEIREILETFGNTKLLVSGEDELVPHIRKWANKLLRLLAMANIKDDDCSDRVIYEARAIAQKGAFVAAPLEYMLTIGGDDRLKVNKSSGLNGFGCSPKPRPWAVTFASSTASSISDYAFAEAEKGRQRLIESICAGRFENQYMHEVEGVKSDLMSVLGLNNCENIHPILTTSGTDAELIALYVTLNLGNEPVMNVLIGPEETGSGVIFATRGRHFSAKTPLGKDVIKDELIEGLPGHRIRLAEVPVRDIDGSAIPIDRVDGRVKALVAKAVADGHRILLHLVDNSKTGLTAPSPETVYALKDVYGNMLEVVVDAAQLRTGQEKLQKYIEKGFMVLLSGSKFYTGPPFAGALILPSCITERLDYSQPLPLGFAGYFSEYELPKNWILPKSHWNMTKNIGLLFRWQAALWEMKAFRAVSEKHKYLIYALFGESILGAISSNPDVRLISIPDIGKWKLPYDAEWDWLQTIFTFIVLGPMEKGYRRPLSESEAKKVYQWLNMNISGFIPNEATEPEKQLAKRRFHIGQPVKIYRMGENWVGALRISAGARLVSGVCFDPGLGRHFAERLSKEIGDACQVLDKISLIIKYMNYIEQPNNKAQYSSDGEPIYIV